MITILLTIALTIVAQQLQQPAKEPKVVGLLLCQKVDPPPPDAKLQTTTLSCHRETTRKLAELQPEAFEIPETYARFIGTNFVIELLDMNRYRFAAKQPEGNTIEYAPPCPERGYQRRPLQAPPCNPELKPQ